MRCDQVVKLCDALTFQIGNNERRVIAVASVIEQRMVAGAHENRQSLSDIEVMDLKIRGTLYGIGCKFGTITTAA